MGIEIIDRHLVVPVFLYKENHALDAWFCIAYGDEQKEN